MSEEDRAVLEEIGLGALVLVVGFPLLLLVSVMALGRLEEWTLRPDERAERLVEILDRAEAVEEVEAAVTDMMAAVADRPERRVRALGGTTRTRWRRRLSPR